MGEIIVITKTELTNLVGEELEKRLRKFSEHQYDDIDEEKISKNKAAKLIGVSLPTLDKLVRQGKFKMYSLGHKKYFLKSEVINTLKNLD